METAKYIKIAVAVIAIIGLTSCGAGSGTDEGEDRQGGACPFDSLTCAILQGFALNARSNQPIPDCRVGIMGSGAGTLSISQQPKNQVGRGPRQTIECSPEELTCGLTDENGFYSLEVPADVTFNVQFTKENEYIKDTFFAVTVAPDQNQELNVVSLVPAEYGVPGQITGTVVAAASRDPLANVRVVFRRGINLYAGTATAEILTDAAGLYETPLPAGNYSIEVIREGFETARLQVVVFGSELTALEPIPLLDSQLAQFLGELEGRVFDALDGSGLEGATVNLRSGFNVTSGPVGIVDVTNATGSYALAAPAGYYTAEVSLNNYNPTFFNAVVEGGTNRSQLFTLLPVLPADSEQIIIVLTWSGLPPGMQGSTAFAVEFGGQPIAGTISGLGPLGSTDAPPFIEVLANLRNGFQETTVISQLDPLGAYEYAVSDSIGSRAFDWAPLSNAKVLLYRGNNLEFTIAVPPPPVVGITWRVFTIDQGRISVLNEFFQPPILMR